MNKAFNPGTGSNKVYTVGLNLRDDAGDGLEREKVHLQPLTRPIVAGIRDPPEGGCVCERERGCVCVCVVERASERRRSKERERERDTRNMGFT